MDTTNAFTPTRLAALADEHPTPFWAYDAATIRTRIAELRGFDTIRYAQKACGNTHLLRLMRAEGVQVDAVSAGEVARALHAGYTPDEIVFTCDVLDRDTLALVVTHGLAVNAGSIDMLDQLGPRSPGHAVWLRVNPGFGHGHSRKTNTGGENSKHGIWHEDLPGALAAVRRHGLQLVGLHLHIGSGADMAHLGRVAAAMEGLVQTSAELGHDVAAVSTGGGLPVPYRPGDERADIGAYLALWNAARQRMEARLGHALRLEIEPGRYLVAEAGVLVSEVRAVKRVGGNTFALVDAGFNDLMRPALYGGHHAIELVGREGGTPIGARPLQPIVVAGPLCESGDVFTQHEGGLVAPRELPRPEVGDRLVLRDTGAYGAAMSSNYNSRPLLAELLVDGDTTRLIRRRQTIDELLALEPGHIATGDLDRRAELTITPSSRRKA